MLGVSGLNMSGNTPSLVDIELDADIGILPRKPLFSSRKNLTPASDRLEAENIDNCALLATDERNMNTVLFELTVEFQDERPRLDQEVPRTADLRIFKRLVIKEMQTDPRELGAHAVRLRPTLTPTFIKWSCGNNIARVSTSPRMCLNQRRSMSVRERLATRATLTIVSQQNARFSCAKGFEAHRGRTMVIREVNEELVEPIKKFLANREGFHGDWDGLFNYSWKIGGYPYGYAILDEEKVAAFIGTIFSERTAGGEKRVFCNLTTWFVEEKYRPQRLGLLVLKPVLTMDNLCITALSPADVTTEILEKFGFKYLDQEQIAVPVVPEMASLIGKGKRGISITFKKSEIQKHLNPEDRKIFEDHCKLACKHFLLREDRTAQYCYGIATTAPLGRFRLLKGQWLNLCYLSDPAVFTRNFRFIKMDLWMEGRFLLLRYDARLLPASLSRMELKKKKTRQFKSKHMISGTVDNLYSELVTFNKY
jgi:hypothetical protein